MCPEFGMPRTQSRTNSFAPINSVPSLQGNAVCFFQPYSLKLGHLVPRSLPNDIVRCTHSPTALPAPTTKALLEPPGILLPNFNPDKPLESRTSPFDHLLLLVPYSPTEFLAFLQRPLKVE